MEFVNESKIKTLLVSCTASIFLQGCGSSSGDDSEVENIGSGGKTNKIENLGALSSDNAEIVALNVAQTLSYLLYENDQFIYIKNKPFIYKNSSLDQDYNQINSCDTGGTQGVKLNAPSKLMVNEYRVLGKGDSISYVYNNCGYEFLNDTIYLNGKVNINVSNGVYDTIDALENPTTIKYAYHNFSLGEKEKNQYYAVNGELTQTYGNESVGLIAEYYAVEDNYDGKTVDFVLTDLNINIIDKSSLFTTRANTGLHTIKAMSVSFNEMNAKFKVNSSISNPVSMDQNLSTNPNSGLVEVSGSTGVVLLYFYNGYFTWKLDGNEDGFFEEQGSIFEN
jgi:hypothetical protein